MITDLAHYQLLFGEHISVWLCCAVCDTWPLGDYKSGYKLTTYSHTMPLFTSRYH